MFRYLCKEEYINIKINKCNYRNFFLNYKNDILFKRFIRRIICFEHYIRRYLIQYLNNYHRLTFSAPDGQYLIYDNDLKYLIYRVGDYRKYNIFISNEYIIHNIFDVQNCIEVLDDLEFQSMELWEIDNLKLDKLHIYNVYFDKTFNTSLEENEYMEYPIKEMKYFYFYKSDEIIDSNNEDQIQPYKLISIPESDFEKYNFQNMLLTL